MILDKDVARLSPFGSRHLNMLGRYAFTIPDMIARGELRPLRDTDATGINDASRRVLCRFRFCCCYDPVSAWNNAKVNYALC